MKELLFPPSAIRYFVVCMGDSIFDKENSSSPSELYPPTFGKSRQYGKIVATRPDYYCPKELSPWKNNQKIRQKEEAEEVVAVGLSKTL